MIGFEDIPILEMPDKSGEAPKRRLSKATVLRSAFHKMRDDDLVNAANRAEHQSLLDNEPPYFEHELQEANMSGVTNLNLGGAEKKLERAMSPYYRLVHSPEDLVRVRTRYGAEDERADLNEILSEEISRTIRNSDLFTFQTLLTIQKSRKEGLGIGFFPDDEDWRFRGGGQGQFYFDRQKLACESDQEIVCVIEEYNVTRLYDMLGGDGWDDSVIKAALQEAANSERSFDDWERMEDEIKNNDYYTAQISPPIVVIHGWVKEFNGKWSHYMTTEAELSTDEKFLYQSHDEYDSLTEALVLFPDGLGTNAKIHGLRGLLFKIYPFEQQFNRSVCRMIDQGVLASSLVLAAEDEDAYNSIGLQYLGNTAVIGPDWKAVQVPMPDLQRSVMPSIDLMERLGNDRAVGYTSTGAFDGDQRKTKFEIAAHLEQDAQLDASQLDIFYGPFERLLQQMVRRMIRRGYRVQEPGGREIRELLLRLIERGVPPEAFYAIDPKATRVVRAIGGGSAAARTMALTQMEELYPRMDDVGKRRFDRMRAIDIVGVSVADMLFPRNTEERTTTETGLAIVQNYELLRGNPIPVLPSDRHLVHARVHIKPLVEVYEAVEGNKEAWADAAMQIHLLYNHCSEHVAAVEGDPQAQQEAAMLRQMLQRIGEVVVNGLEAAAARAEEEGAEEGGGGPTQEQVQKAEEHRQKMQQQQEKHEFEMRRMVEKAAVEDAVADAKGAASIKRDRLKG